TSEQLKELVQRGPAALDGSKLPRHVRAPLRRGLDPDPARRWPSVAKLLDALAPRRSRVRIAAAAAVGAAGVATLVLWGGLRAGETAASCGVAQTPADVWSGVPHAKLQSANPALVALFDGDAARWYGARDAVCTRDDKVPACLDAVLTRADAVRRA